MDREALILENLPLVGYVRGRWFSSPPSDVAEEDLLSTGRLALCAAAGLWDPAKGTRFSTYAVSAIYRRMAGLCGGKPRVLADSLGDVPVEVAGDADPAALAIERADYSILLSVLKEKLTEAEARLLQGRAEDPPATWARLAEETGLPRKRVQSAFEAARAKVVGAVRPVPEEKPVKSILLAPEKPKRRKMPPHRRPNRVLRFPHRAHACMDDATFEKLQRLCESRRRAPSAVIRDLIAAAPEPPAAP